MGKSRIHKAENAIHIELELISIIVQRDIGESRALTNELRGGECNPDWRISFKRHNWKGEERMSRNHDYTMAENRME